MADIPETVYGDATPPPLRRSAPMLAFAVIAVGLVNAAKPVHVDDALYLAIAQQILKNPLDPYGFEINWQHTPRPAYAVSISPPLLSYYHALGMALGFHEDVALHLMMMPWLALFAWGVAALLRRAGMDGRMATVALLLSPAVMAEMNLMLDVPMSACLTTGVEVLFRGLDRRSWRLVWLSGLLGAAAVLIKYPALVFAGLCIAVALLQRNWRALVPALCCTAGFAAWQLASRALYGTGQVQQASSFLEQFHGEGGRKTIERVCEQFVLLGAGFPLWIVTFFHGRSRTLGAMFALAAAAVGAWLLTESRAITGDAWSVGGFLLGLCLGVFMVAEALCSALRYAPDRRLTLLAGLWFFSIVGLTTVSAPFVALRYLLPALPALLVLQATALRPTRGTWVATAVVSALLGFATAVTDARRASFYPRTVAAIRTNHPAATIYFSGHWGWQWYAEKAGMSAWDARWTDAPAGTLIAVPRRADPTPIHPQVRARMVLQREFILPPAPLGISVWRPTRPNEIGICLYGWEFPHLPSGFHHGETERIGLFEVR